MTATPTRGGVARRWGGGAALGAAGAYLLALALLPLAGIQPLTVLSGSMAPAIRAGDLVLVRPTLPGAVRAGQVVTFPDPSRDGRLVTHRAVEVEPRPGEVAFTTRGDRNSSVERWSVPAGGRVGVTVVTVAWAGYPLHWLSLPPVRVALLLAATAVAGTFALRRIWSA